jgi:hypothetical protein
LPVLFSLWGWDGKKEKEKKNRSCYDSFSLKEIFYMISDD